MFQTNIRQVLGYLFPQIISFHWNIVKKRKHPTPILAV